MAGAAAFTVVVTAAFSESGRGLITFPAGPVTPTANTSTAGGVPVGGVGAGLGFLPFTATGRHGLLGQLGAAIHLGLPAAGLLALLIGATQAVTQPGETGSDAVAQVLPRAVGHGFTGGFF